jgi:hypothetical protein
MRREIEQILEDTAMMRMISRTGKTITYIILAVSGILTTSLTVWNATGPFLAYSSETPAMTWDPESYREISLRVRNYGLRDATSVWVWITLSAAEFTGDYIVFPEDLSAFAIPKSQCIPTPDHACAPLEAFVLVIPGGKTFTSYFPRFRAGVDVTISANYTLTGFELQPGILGKSDQQGDIRRYSEVEAELQQRWVWVYVFATVTGVCIGAYFLFRPGRKRRSNLLRMKSSRPPSPSSRS